MLTEDRSISCSSSTKFQAAAMYSDEILIFETASWYVVFFSASKKLRDVRQIYWSCPEGIHLRVFCHTHAARSLSS